MVGLINTPPTEKKDFILLGGSGHTVDALPAPSGDQSDIKVRGTRDQVCECLCAVEVCCAAVSLWVWAVVECSLASATLP